MLFVMCVCGHIKRNKSGSLLVYFTICRDVSIIKKIAENISEGKKHTHRHKQKRDKDMKGKVECILNV